MITSPNQRVVSIKRNVPKKETSKAFAYIYIDAIQDASKSLNGETAFKLWMYFASNKDNYTFAFSPKAFSEAYNCSEKSAREAFTQLVEKRYLISGNRKNEFVFYEKPVAASITAVEEKREFIDNDTNTLYYWTYNELLQQIQNKQTADSLWISAKIVRA